MQVSRGGDERSSLPSNVQPPQVVTFSAGEVLVAHERTRALVHRTPLEPSLALSELVGASVFLKCEHSQYTGSFKLRGASNTLVKRLASLQSLQHSLPKSQVAVVTASTGNHGLAVSFAARRLGLRAAVYVPHYADRTKLRSIEALGSKVIPAGDNCVVAERTARAAAQQSGAVYISPYNDLDIIAGQGTVAVEIVQQMRELQDQTGPCGPDVVFVSVGGGGLIGGIATYLKAVNPSCRVIGVQPQNSRVMYESVRAGRILQDVPEEPTLSDGTAGGIEEHSVTFAMCQNLVDEYVVVSEEDIRVSLVHMFKREHMYVEGAAALAVAGLLRYAQDNSEWLRGKRCVVVLCGRNMSLDRVLEVITPRSKL